jgi:hypothetical protein
MAMRERRYSDNWVPDWLHLLTCPFCRRARASETETSGRPDVPTLSVVMTDHELTAALAEIWDGSQWRRLEVCTRWSAMPSGYCIPLGQRPIETRDALARPDCPPAIVQLRELLKLSGWSRLELLGRPGQGFVSGWCERPDRTGTRVRFEVEGGR